MGVDHFVRINLHLTYMYFITLAEIEVLAGFSTSSLQKNKTNILKRIVKYNIFRKSKKTLDPRVLNDLVFKLVFLLLKKLKGF